MTGLDRPMTFSTKPQYRCLTCREELWTERSPRTRWQEWWFTRDGRRHFKTRCNMPPDKEEQAKCPADPLVGFHKAGNDAEESRSGVKVPTDPDSPEGEEICPVL